MPNLTFSKTNFTGYNIQIRGIGTQAISVTTDPAVAVAFNDTPFIRNHFFEQEFYDVGQLEVLRGPARHALWPQRHGRRREHGVGAADRSIRGDALCRYRKLQIRRFEGMVNIPIVDDRLDLRVAGEWTKRNGYTFNETTDEQVDGRDLWSGRVTLGLKPSEHLQAYLIWEHFSEDDDRERSTKQLCNSDPGPTQVGPFNQSFTALRWQFGHPSIIVQITKATCSTSVLIGRPEARSVRVACRHRFIRRNPIRRRMARPCPLSMPRRSSAMVMATLIQGEDPYASETQSRNLRVIQSAIKPLYKAKNDIVEFMMDYDVTPGLKLTSQTGFNHDFLASTEDFNRFNSNPGLFFSSADQTKREDRATAILAFRFTPGGLMCDPQLGCSDRFVGEDLSQEHAWQISQEVRLASDFSGPFNFSVGANYLHYETLEDYYVFLNVLTTDFEISGFGASSAPTGERPLSRGPQSQVFTPIGHSTRHVELPLHGSHAIDARDLTGRGTIISAAPILMCSVPMPDSAKLIIRCWTI